MTVESIERASSTTFTSLGVPPALVAALAATGVQTPFPIQTAVLPDALAGADILGRGRTGSGKTLGFCVPMVARLTGARSKAGSPRGLVLAPTRELASQIERVLQPLVRAAGLTVATIYGGTSQRPQVTALRRRVDIVVACPGRLADLIEQGHCQLGDVEISVVDEADHMADLGFLPDVRELLDATPSDGQRMLFSATLDHAVDVLVRRFLHDPAEHSVDPPGTSLPITHHLLTVAPAERTEIIAALASGESRSLIFTRTKLGAQRLARQLTMANIPATELHGDLSQAVRARNLARFASGAVRVLVATDIAARGLHVDGIGLVIHADVPAEHKAYLHRSGRTGRAGAEGTVVTLQSKSQSGHVRAMMRRASIVPLTATVRPHSELLRSIAGEPAAPPQVPLLLPAQSPAQSTLQSPAQSRSRPSAAQSAGTRGKPGDRGYSGDRGRPGDRSRRARHGGKPTSGRNLRRQPASASRSTSTRSRPSESRAA